jgi:predicted transcriptional regulator
MADDASFDLSALTADIVSAYVSNNKVEPTKLADIIGEVHRALGSAGQSAEPAEPEAPKPDKAAIKKSLTPDHITSFIDGRKYKSLKRHLTTQGLSPGEYRERFGLPKDYPMVAPSYSAQRSALAKTLGLGRGGRQPTGIAAELEPTPAPAPAPEPTPAKRGRGRPKAMAEA